MRLRDAMLGTRAIKRVKLPLVNVPSNLLPDIPELAAQRAKDLEASAANAPPGSVSGASVVPEVGVRVLTGLEQATIYKLAAEFSRERGGNPELATDPLYGLGISVFTLVLSCVDPDSDPNSPRPFFGEIGDPKSGAEELLSSPHIGRDGILYLQEEQETWQDLCAPQALKLDPEKLWEIAGEVAASSDAGPFLRLRPGMRWKLTRFLAALCVSLPTSSIASSSDGPTPSAN